MLSLDLLTTLLLVSGSALAAGLTMGLLSLDGFDLLVVSEADENDCASHAERVALRSQKRSARALLPLIEDRHRLLVTLLLLNSACSETLPVVLDDFMKPVFAVMLSMILLLTFGEILPSAVFTGPQGMKISAGLAPLVKVLLVLFAPVAVPVAWVLDWWLGEEEEMEEGGYNKPELKALLRLHAGHSPHHQLTNVEARMMNGVMDLMTKRAQDIMTHKEDLFMMDVEEVLDLEMMARVVGKGHARIPVFEMGDMNRVRGVLLTKTLAVVNPADARVLKSFGLRIPACVGPTWTLGEVLQRMKLSKSHMCFVTDDPKRMHRNMRRKYENMSLNKTSSIASKTSFASLVEGGIAAATAVATAVVPELVLQPAPQPLQPPVFLGCITLLDVIQCMMDDEIHDEFLRRRRPNPSRTRESSQEKNEDDSDSDYEGDHGENADASVQERPSDFAMERLHNWAERAKLRMKLRQQLNQAAAVKRVSNTNLSATVATGSSPVSKSSMAALPGLVATYRADPAIVKYTANWLLKRSSKPDINVVRGLSPRKSNMPAVQPSLPFSKESFSSTTRFVQTPASSMTGPTEETPLLSSKMPANDRDIV